MLEAAEYLKDFRAEACKSLGNVGQDEFYVEAIQELLGLYSNYC